MRIVLITVLLLGVVLPSDAEEKKFDLSGFADFKLVKNIFDEHSFYHYIGESDALTFSLNHVNLYLDFRPSEFTRALTEIRFMTQPHGTLARPGVFKNIVNAPFPADTTPPVAPIDNSTYDSDGGNMVWGTISLERMHFDLLFSQPLAIRFGRMITPVGIWNVDHGSPVILTINQPYQSRMVPLFPTVQDGIALFGRSFLGDLDLDYTAYISTGRGGIQIRKPRDIGVGANAGVSMPLLKGLDVGISGYTGMIRKGANWGTLAFTVNPMDFRRTVDVQIGEGFADPANRTFEWRDTLLAREACLGVDLKFSPIRGLTLQCEYNGQRVENYLKSDSNLAMTIGGYELISYRIRAHKHLTITPYGMMEFIKAYDAQNTPGATWFARSGVERDGSGMNLDGFTNWIAGVNLNVFMHASLKFEWAYVNSHTAGSLENYQETLDRQTVSALFGIAF